MERWLKKLNGIFLDFLEQLLLKDLYATLFSHNRIIAFQEQTALNDYEEIKSYDRSSCPEVFCKKNVPKNFAKFKGKRMC